ncbi:unnamed protein product, partial [Amoebophrya sp. A25]
DVLETSLSPSSLRKLPLACAFCGVCEPEVFDRWLDLMVKRKHGNRGRNLGDVLRLQEHQGKGIFTEEKIENYLGEVLQLQEHQGKGKGIFTEEKVEYTTTWTSESDVREFLEGLSSWHVGSPGLQQTGLSLIEERLGEHQSIVDIEEKNRQQQQLERSSSEQKKWWTTSSSSSWRTSASPFLSLIFFGTSRIISSSAPSGPKNAAKGIQLHDMTSASSKRKTTRFFSGKNGNQPHGASSKGTLILWLRALSRDNCKRGVIPDVDGDFPAPSLLIALLKEVAKEAPKFDKRELVLIGNALSYPSWRRAVAGPGGGLGFRGNGSANDNEAREEEEGGRDNFADQEEQRDQQEEEGRDKNIAHAIALTRDENLRKISSAFEDCCQAVGVCLAEDLDLREGKDGHTESSMITNEQDKQNFSRDDLASIFRFSWAICPNDWRLLGNLLRAMEMKEKETNKEQIMKMGEKEVSTSISKSMSQQFR